MKANNFVYVHARTIDRRKMCPPRKHAASGHPHTPHSMRVLDTATEALQLLLAKVEESGVLAVAQTRVSVVGVVLWVGVWM